MGKVAAVYNMIPESPESPLEDIIKSIPGAIPEGVTINNVVVKPFAFGLKIIEITCIMDDTSGIIEKLEEALRSVPQIQSVENTTVTLI
ncbi:MAG: elongation factor 1-beta [Methanomassiliicoccus sp.]|jgi:elongation factor 1-beta|nr:elongation factor 1-beta [Methanomassiliicoccus sp.]